MALFLQSNVHGGLMRFLFKFQTWPMRLTLISELSIFVNLISYILLGLLVLKNARFRLFCTPIKRFQLSINFDSRNVLSRLIRDDPCWSRFIQVYPGLSRFIRDDPCWSRFIRVYPGLSRFIRDDPSWSEMIQVNPR